MRHPSHESFAKVATLTPPLSKQQPRKGSLTASCGDLYVSHVIVRAIRRVNESVPNADVAISSRIIITIVLRAFLYFNIEQ